MSQQHQILDEICAIQDSMRDMVGEFVVQSRNYNAQLELLKSQMRGDRSKFNIVFSSLDAKLARLRAKLESSI